jgi:cytochrome P450
VAASPPPLSALPYTEAVLKETMRLMPPVSLLNRIAAEDTQLGGYAIPKGTSVLVTLTAIMRDPAHFPEPLAFRPERFLAGGDSGSVAAAMTAHPLAWAPFGAGPRQCVGARFAAQEAVLALAVLTRDVDVALPPGAPPLRMREGITNAPADGLRVRATRRQRAHSHAA